MPQRSSTRRRGPALQRLLLALSCLALASAFGCAPKPAVAPEPEPPELAGVAEKAESAWQAGDRARAAELYLRLARSGGLDRRERLQAWQRAAEGFLEAGRPERAGEALEGWAETAPEAEQTWAWQRLQADLHQLRGDREALRRALEAFCLSSEAEWAERRQALERLSGHFLRSGEPNEAWRVHEAFYARTERTERRAQLEEALLKRLRALDGDGWETVRQAFTPETDWTYPYALVEWVSTVRHLRQEALSWSHAWERLSSLLERSRLEKKPHLHTVFVSLEEQYGQPALGIALLLPLSGVYEDIGWSICRGADVALWQLNKRGADIHVRLINTMNQDWPRELERLPKNYMAVGGPLRHAVWEEIMERGLQEERVFFAFRPALSPGWEGIDGYRFFPSHADQLRPLVRLMRDRLELSTFGILYPDSSYGRRMAEAFWREVTAREGRVTALSSYSPRKHAQLQGVVADFLKVPEEERSAEAQESLEVMGQNGTNATVSKRPDPDFEAVFIPDSFSKARLIIPEFFYFDEPRLIFLGPALWSQEMEDVSRVDRQYYRLAAMSGAWWSGRSSQAAARLRQGLKETAQGDADFWVGLGYDFLRFASSLGPIPPDWSPERITASLAAFSNFNWSIAPLSWNRHGEARQELYVLRAHGRGSRRLDSGRLGEARQEILERFEQLRKRDGQERKDAAAQGEEP